MQGAIRTYSVPLNRQDGLGPLCTPAVDRIGRSAHDGKVQSSRSHSKRATQHIRLCFFYGAYEHSYFLTMPSSLAPLRLYAGRCTVASRFRCQPCGCGYIVRGLDDESAEQAYAAIRRWMNVRGYRPAGAKRELNLGQMLEIQFPVAQNWFNRESLGSDWNSFLIKPVASWLVFSCRLSAQLHLCC